MRFRFVADALIDADDVEHALLKISTYLDEMSEDEAREPNDEDSPFVEGELKLQHVDDDFSLP